MQNHQSAESKRRHTNIQVKKNTSMVCSPNAWTNPLWNQIAATVKPRLWRPSGLRRHLWWQSHLLPGRWTRGWSHCTRPSAGYPSLQNPQFSDWDDPTRLKKNIRHHYRPNITTLFNLVWYPLKIMTLSIFSRTLSIPLWCWIEAQKPLINFKIALFRTTTQPSRHQPFF